MMSLDQQVDLNYFTEKERLAAAKKTAAKLETQTNLLLKSSRCFRPWTRVDERVGLFDRSEIVVGRLLGEGGFSEVYEVESIRMHKSNDPAVKKYSHRQCEARELIGRNTQRRNGESRFVIKHLRKGIWNKKVFQNAAIDLALEAFLFLRCLDHPNILKMRGVASEGLRSYNTGLHDGFFVLMDRLDDTLDRRIEKWQKKPLSEPTIDNFLFLIQRVKYALQIGSALEYLHENRVIHRDLKPGNIGFRDGTVKLFDFGLSRELPEDAYGMDEVYEMTGEVGTRRYMAPEVATNRLYGAKADVYSWSMVFWEILQLEKPFAPLSKGMHLIMVCELGQRPAISSDWPAAIEGFLCQCWAQEEMERPSMESACSMLNEIVTNLEVQGESLQEMARNLEDETSSSASLSDSDLEYSQDREIPEISNLKKDELEDVTLTTESSSGASSSTPSAISHETSKGQLC
jgi:serine/threonine protein kinase